MFRIFRTNGPTETHEGMPTRQQLYTLLGCSTIEVVRLKKGYLLCDEEGMLDRKPINPEATLLYHTSHGTPFPIAGDAAWIAKLSDLREEPA